MKVCLGGTFEPFHVGHQALLRAAAADASRLFVGITDGALARRPRKVASWQERGKLVERFVGSIGYGGELIVRALDDPAGPAATEDYDRIVVSPETKASGDRINAARRDRGLAPLEVVVVPHVVGPDLLVVSSTRIAAGDIRPDGGRARPLRIVVGSKNEAKIEGARAAFAGLGIPLDVAGLAVPSGVAEQPRQEATLAGARSRAMAALRLMPAAEYAVGIEAGLVLLPGDDQPVDVQVVVVVDQDGWATQGYSPAYHLPSWMLPDLHTGATISDFFGPLSGDPRVGSTVGAVGFLSQGAVTRGDLVRLGVEMALLPRRNRTLYRRTD